MTFEWAPDPYARARRWMVRKQLRGRGITNEAVLVAMDTVPREEFVPPQLRGQAYADCALPIGRGATISQPYIVAHMIQLAGVGPGSRVLEIGTGSGYQAAVLDTMGARVFTVEIDEVLAREARSCLRGLGHDDVLVTARDGWNGWPEHSPYDAILVTAGPMEIPPALGPQLTVGGRLVLPVGPPGVQHLVVVTRTPRGYDQRSAGYVAFVPMCRAAPAVR